MQDSTNIPTVIYSKNNKNLEHFAKNNNEYTELPKYVLKNVYINIIPLP